MKRRLKILVLLSVASALLGLLGAAAQPHAQKVDFQRDIAPIFAAHCAGCHGAGKMMSGLRLDDKQSAARVIAAGDSGSSRLVHRLLGAGGEARMPMNGAPLGAEQIALIKRWIDEGAEWPERESGRAGEREKQTTQKHWAFVAPARPAVPALLFHHYHNRL